MTHLQPPTPEPEFLESGTAAAGPARSGRGKAVGLGIGAVVAAGAVAAGAWGVSKLTGGGPGAAEVLPASALAYVSVDLDPAAGQKIEAFKTMKKFPALRTELNLDSQDDLRKMLVEAIVEDDDCELSYADDVEPWLGNKLGVAVLTGDEYPEPVVALQSTDEDKAIDGVKRAVEECSPGEEVGVTSLDGYVLIGSSQQVVDDARKAASEKPLSEDDAFNDQLDKVGGQGIVSFYVAKAAAIELTKVAEEGLGVDDLGGSQPSLDQLDDFADDFEGAAGTLRFSDGGVELEAVVTSPDVSAEGATTDVGNLPDTTVAALGFGVSTDQLDQLSENLSKSGLDEAGKEFEQQTGVSIDEAIRTLLGNGLVLAVDGTSDFSSLESGPDGIKAGIRINGDPDKITDLLDKTLGMAGGLPAPLTTEKSDDGVAIGVGEDYLKQLLEGGDLGSSAGFESAVPHADEASGVLYLDADGPNDWLVDLATSGGGTDTDTIENLRPLNTFGASTWTEGGDGHFLLKLTTD
ncbi:MAG: DUF3352 domain-containing protein [Nocardioidaceae bacterium]